MSLSRRQFNHRVFQALLAASLPFPVRAGALVSSPVRTVTAASPLAPMSGTENPADFDGDEPDFPHEILWNKAEWISKLGGLPVPDRQEDVVIVGGGIAGLTAAYRLRDYGPLLLEGARRFGGNAKGETWNGTAFSMGAAYVAHPDEGDPTHTLLNDLGLWESMRLEDASELTVSLDGGLLKDFWSGASDPARADEFKRVYERLVWILDNRFPDIPLEEGSAIDEAELHRLDRANFRDWLAGEFGELHPHVREFMELYCWTSFAAESGDLSAAQVLNFMCSDLGGVLALPGGNAAIAERLYSRIGEAAGSDRLVASTYVLDVRVEGERVRVTYLDGEKRLRAVSARVCVMACPKFVAQRLIDELPEAQLRAMRGISYQAYVVGNVLIDGRFDSPGYDLFRLTGEVPLDPRNDLKHRPYADYICAGWAGGDQGDRTVLTLYRPLPYHGAKQFLYNPFAYGKHRGIFERAFPELSASLGIEPARIRGLRLTRWGHALPLAYTGLIAEGRPQLASRPVGGRVFFANQDNLASPCIEAAIGEAERAAAAVRVLLS